MLTLPLCGIIKHYYPRVKIYFLGKPYTQPLINCCSYVDDFINVEDLPQVLPVKADAIIFVYPDKKVAKWAYQQNIPIRIGTSHRFIHWLYANKRVHFTRKNSPLHEAQLNSLLLKPLGIRYLYTTEELTSYIAFAPATAIELPTIEVPYILLHPKSKGSAREWPLKHYAALALWLKNKGYEVGITGTAPEGEKIKAEMPEFYETTQATDLTGKCSLAQLIALINGSNGLVACSTGPLHIAAALGVKAVGIYPPIKPMHAGRWAPIGKNTVVLQKNTTCNICKHTNYCPCVENISPEDVLMALEK